MSHIYRAAVLLPIAGSLAFPQQVLLLTSGANKRTGTLVGGGGSLRLHQPAFVYQ
jgi:hypothetical protein